MDEQVKNKLDHLDKSVGERFKSIRLEQGLTQAQYGARLGRTLQTINRVERGKRAPDAEVIAGLREQFNVDILWLLTGRRDPDLETGTRVPLLKEIPKNLENVPPAAIRSHIRFPGLPDHAWAIQVSGEDMVPTIREGDYVVFLIAEPKEGDLALYCFEGGVARVRRFSSKDGGLLIAEAPGCPAIPVGEVRVIGRVLQVVRHIELAGRP